MGNRVAEDPRIDPRLKAMFADWTPPILPDIESREALMAMLAGAGEGMLGMAMEDAPYEAAVPSAGLSVRTEAIRSEPDGNSINLRIVTPDGAGPFACVYYIHGGGMMAASCTDPNYRAWARLIAAQGVVVVAVDFRNALTPSSVPEVAPYPAGLNDCASGLRWVHAHAAELNIDPARIVIEGESGGANLTIATALKLKREGDIGLVKGLYVGCPYLAGEWPGAEGSSALGNAGILMDVRSNFGAMVYGIEGLRARDPLAWPGFATEADVAGLPPVVVTVNECDPLRDDGVDFYRLLLRAGVPARCKELIGTVHGTEIYILPCPEISRDAARDIAAFARE
ncbi:esterase [Nostoc sp. 3335mG]|nr:esterase [Nostoc sp. 3335mG]